MPTNPTLKILFASSEAFPLVKVGGLGDVAGSLPNALLALPLEATQGYTLDIRLAIPFHPVIPRDNPTITFVINFQVPHPKGPKQASAYLTHIGATPVYLIDGDDIPKQGGVYSLDTQKDGEKYTFFSLAVLELCRALDWKPDILHAQDWHTAIALHILKQLRSSDPFFQDVKSVFTVHNLPFMGAGTDEALRSFGIPESDDPLLPPWGHYQPLPMGLSAADLITTVSPTYGREIMTSEFGCGLETFLQNRASSVIGVLNGLDLSSADPATDPALVTQYDSATLAKRIENKLALQKEFNLEVNPNIPLIISIGRFDYQKGIDLAVDALAQVSNQPWQAILLGSGNPSIEATARSMEQQYPDRLRAAIRFDGALSKRMYAGGDMLLIPSRYEPCGLTQMFAMRYGCVPVARATGGLRDTIFDTPDPKTSTGFLFEAATAEALAEAIRRALVAYADKPEWIERQLYGMSQDFAWSRFAQTYVELYLNVLQQ
jgi:starch synthase